jgi:hypothetical protein
MSLRSTISEVRNIGHHQSLYDWGIQFFNLPSILTGFTSADLNTRCQTANLPSKSIDEIEINLRGHKVFQHGKINYKNKLNLTLYETQDSKVGDFLDAYMNMQWTPITGSQVPKSLNQCCFLLTLLDSENNARKNFTIIGAWLQDYTPSGDLGSDSAVLSYNTVWTFDYWL